MPVEGGGLQERRDKRDCVGKSAREGCQTCMNGWAGFWFDWDGCPGGREMTWRRLRSKQLADRLVGSCRRVLPKQFYNDYKHCLCKTPTVSSCRLREALLLNWAGGIECWVQLVGFGLVWQRKHVQTTRTVDNKQTPRALSITKGRLV